MNKFKIWIAERKALSIRNIESEAGIPFSILNKVLKGHRELPERYKPELLKVAKKYGYDGDTLSF